MYVRLASSIRSCWFNGHHFQVAGTLLKGKVTLKQLENYFNNNAWNKYKYANDLEEHTGGGDGDEDREIPRERAPRKSKARAGKPSTRTLNQFRRSKVYQLLHSVYVFSSSYIVVMTSLRLTQGISRCRLLLRLVRSITNTQRSGSTGFPTLSQRVVLSFEEVSPIGLRYICYLRLPIWVYWTYIRCRIPIPSCLETWYYVRRLSTELKMNGR